MTLIKSISGIRGTIGGAIGDNLTPLDAVKFTASYAKWLVGNNPGRKLTVVVGRDARLSGEMVNDLVEGTLLGCGVNVINVGLCTTPGVEMAVVARGADGGIILTASHNPKQWNALKLLNQRGEFLNAAEGAKILEYAVNEEFDFVEIDQIGKVLSREPYDVEHIDAVLALPLVDVELVKKQNFKVAVDAVDSVGGVVIPALLERMGCEVVKLYCEPTGNFSHNPEPVPENLTEICKVVKESGADLGVIVDPDVDRLALVSETGELFGEEYTLVACADYILSLAGGGNTVSNLSSSRALRDVTEKHGGSYAAAAVGEVNVVAKMKEVGAVIGGEGNGGVIYPESHYGRDALVGVALFLSLLAHKGCRMSELKATYPQYHISKNKIQLTPEIDVDKVLAIMFNRYTDHNVTDIDGVKIDFPTEWVHLRKSNTEPIIRIYSESRDEDSAERLARGIMNEIGEIVKGN